VTDDPADPLPPEAALALAWSGPMVRAPLSTVLQLDRRLARIVARTREPMLGQMRLAWWRDALGKPAAERPRGDAVLDAVGAHWAGREAALVALVDGWEVLVTAERLDGDQLTRFAAGRGAFFEALAGEEAPAALRDHLRGAGQCWALADAAAGVSDPVERQALVAAGLEIARGAVRLPRNLRGLAVLDALARRALAHGGRPLMMGRGAPLAVLRAAILGA
jgi:phytoene synthase